MGVDPVEPRAGRALVCQAKVESPFLQPGEGKASVLLETRRRASIAAGSRVAGVETSHDVPSRDRLARSIERAQITQALLHGWGHASADVTPQALIPAFLISELKTAFQMGFLVYVPFLVLDLVVASILTSMGMVMLPPVLISLPFKLMLFVLVDGWNVLVGSLVQSFR